jgi:hypothetical protein
VHPDAGVCVSDVHLDKAVLVYPSLPDIPGDHVAEAIAYRGIDCGNQQG